MKNKQAIRLIEKKIDEAKKLPDGYTGEWQRITSTIVCKVLEPKSDEHYRVEQMSNVHFSAHYHGGNVATAGHLARTDIVNRLTHALEQIKVHGPYNPPRQNFLSTVSDAAIWTTIGIAVPAIFYAGHIVGNHSSDMEKVELRQEVRQLKEHLSTPVMPSSNQDPQQEANEVKEQHTAHDSSKHLIGK